jgi:hypothetical protein
VTLQRAAGKCLGTFFETLVDGWMQGNGHDDLPRCDAARRDCGGMRWEARGNVFGGSIDYVSYAAQISV